MKFIQSFWTFKNNPDKAYSAGFISTKYHLLSWVLNYHSIVKFYSDIEIHTDDLGYDILINDLKLPFNRVELTFNANLPSYPKFSMAYRKMYCFSRQTQPFLHIDSDIGIWKPFSNTYLLSDIVTQNPDINDQFYIGALKEIKNAFKKADTKLPVILENIVLGKPNENPIVGYNAGLFGGNNIEFIQYFCNFGFDFLTNYYHIFENYDFKFNLNIILDQYFLALLAESKNIPITCYTNSPTTDDSFPNFTNFTALPDACDYIHIMGAKRYPTTCEQLDQRVKIDYPEQYERVLSVAKLLDKKSILITDTSKNSIQTLNESNINKFYRTLDCLKHLKITVTNKLFQGGSKYVQLKIVINKIKNLRYRKIVSEILEFENEKEAWINQLPPMEVVAEYKDYQSKLLNELLLEKAEDNILLLINPHTSVFDHEWNWAERFEFRKQEDSGTYYNNLYIHASSFRIVFFVYPSLRICREFLCDDLDIAIINEFVDAPKIRWKTLIANVLKETEVSYSPKLELFHKSLREKLKFFIYQQVLAIEKEP